MRRAKTRPTTPENIPSDRVIDRDRPAAPGLLRSPRFRRAAPEWIARRQSERQERFGAQIQASGRDIGFAHARLMSAESDPEPAFLVESAVRFERAADNGCQRATNLFR